MMKAMLFAAAMGLAIGSGTAFAAADGLGGPTLPHVAATPAQGSQNAIPPSYGSSTGTPTASAPSSNGFAEPGPKTKTASRETTPGMTTNTPTGAAK